MPATGVLGSVRIRGAGLIVVGFAVVACAAILYLTRRFDFYYDEWDWVLGNSHWTLRDYFLPHNEHWSTFPAVVYKLLFLTFGARSYLPFISALMLLHASAALLLFVLIRRRAGDLCGIAAALVLLFLGRGSENIIWAFQIGFVGSMVFGLAAMVLVDRPNASGLHLAAASASLILALTSSGMGLFFIVAIAFDLILDPSRRSYLVVLALPAAAYLIWFLAFGSHRISVHRSPWSIAALLSLHTYVPYGIGAATAGLLGLSATWQEPALIGLVALLTLSWVRRGRPPDSRMIGAAIALVAMYSSIGLVRSQFGDIEAASARYVYNASAFLLPLLADAVRDIEWGALGRVALGAVVVASLFLNGLALRNAAHERNAIFDVQATKQRVVYLYRHAPDLDLDARFEPQWMPPVTVRGYLETRAELGSMQPPVTQAALAQLNRPAVDQAMRQIFPLRAVEASQSPSTGSCRTVAAGQLLDLTLTPGQRLTVSGEAPGDVKLYPWYLAGPPQEPSLVTAVARDRRLGILVPNTGMATTWHLRVDLPHSGSHALCVV